MLTLHWSLEWVLKENRKVMDRNFQKRTLKNGGIPFFQSPGPFHHLISSLRYTHFDWTFPTFLVNTCWPSVDQCGLLENSSKNDSFSSFGMINSIQFEKKYVLNSYHLIFHYFSWNHDFHLITHVGPLLSTGDYVCRKINPTTVDCRLLHCWCWLFIDP